MEAAYINIQQVLCNPNRGLTLAHLGEFGLLQYFFYKLSPLLSSFSSPAFTPGTEVETVLSLLYCNAMALTWRPECYARFSPLNEIAGVAQCRMLWNSAPRQ